jgi:hypothetical protein
MYLDTLIPEFQSTDYTTPGDIRMAEPGFKNPYTQHWNVTVQTSLGRDMAVEIGYVGSRSVHLDFETWGRKLAPLYGREDFWLGQNLHISTAGNDAQYNALQFSLQKRYSAGLSFRLNYTYANLMNDTDEYFDAATSGHYVINKRAEWARSQADLRHNFNFSGLYELPFGRGRRFGDSWHRGLDAVLGGWRISYILEANSGAPINVLWGGNFRPDLVEGKDPNLSDPSPSRWFDTTAFKVQGCVQPCQGNVGRTVIEGPNFGNLDLSIAKSFTITETHRVEVRGEAFNATNHPNLFRGGQQVDVTQPGADRLLNSFPMRRVQLAVRYSF